MLETLSLEYFVRIVAAILFVAALLLLVVWALKVRFQGKYPGKEGAIQVVQKTQIDTRHSVTVLEYNDQKFLLASGPGGLALLEVQSPHAKTSDEFNKLLHGEIDNQGSPA